MILTLQEAIDRIDDERTGELLSSRAVSDLNEYQKDMAAARAWAFGRALEILADIDRTAP